MKKTYQISAVLAQNQGILDLHALRGDTFEAEISIIDLGQARVFDFSQYASAKMQVRKTRLDLPILEFYSTVGTEIVLTADKVTVSKDATTMAGKTSGIYLYDLQLTDISGNVYTPLSGKFIIKDDITY